MPGNRGTYLAVHHAKKADAPANPVDCMVSKQALLSVVDIINEYIEEMDLYLTNPPKELKNHYISKRLAAIEILERIAADSIS